MPQWNLVLEDPNGQVYGDLPQARSRKLTFARNRAMQLELTLDLDDTRAQNIANDIANGFSRVRSYRDGVLRQHVRWAAMQEDANASSATNTIVFRGPFADYEKAFTGPLITYAGYGIGADGLDAGLIASSLIRQANVGSRYGLRIGNVAQTVKRFRTYESKQVAEAIIQLTEVSGGFDFQERPIETASGTEILATNYVRNPSAETNLNQWSATGGGTVNRENITIPGGAGTWVARVDGGKGTGRRQTGISVTSGQRYYVRTARVTSGEAELIVTNGSDVDKFRTRTSEGHPGILEGEFVADATASDWRIYLQQNLLSASGDHYTYWDAIMLTEISQAGERPPYFDGSYPGAQWTGVAHESESLMVSRLPDVIGYLDIYTSLGTNLSGTIAFEYGKGTRETADSVQRQWLPPINRVLVRGEDQLLGEAQDLTSIGKYGVRMQVISASDGTIEQTSLNAAALDALRPNPLEIVTFQPNPITAPQPWTNYWIGDTVGVRAREGAMNINAAARVNSIEITLDDDGNEISHSVTFEAQAA